MMMSHRFHQTIWIYLSSFVFISLTMEAQKIDETKCFNKTMHYFSNPEITGRSKLYINYKNDDFTNVQLNLKCNKEQPLRSNIKVEDVFLVLPVYEKDLCLESQETSFRTCNYYSQCECCLQPATICRRPVQQLDLGACNGNSSCTLEVKSAFLEDCPGREYDCEKKKCHSRWAQVIYTCEQQPDMVKETQLSTKNVINNKDRLTGPSSKCTYIHFKLKLSL